jgi:LacI family transcriptional regulator
MIEQNKVTIYDLARRLNTTASTVSRALQNNPRISLKMREAVQQLAKELNYQPDPIAHHLRTGKGFVLGIIVPRIDRNFFAATISSFQETVSKQNYNVIIAASNESFEEEQRVIRALINKKIDGIAISLSVESAKQDYAETCAGYNIPVVFFDRVPASARYDTVSNDNFQIGYDAVVQLYKTGCTRIGHFAGPQSIKSYSDRFLGYKQALKDLGLAYREDWVFPNSITLETGTEAAQRLLASANRPDGIFSAGDFSAITAMDTLACKGLSIPRDIAFIGVANEPFDNYLRTPLSSFDLHQQRIGEVTARLLLSRIKDDGDERFKAPANIIVKHDLILRDSAIHP